METAVKQIESKPIEDSVLISYLDTFTGTSQIPVPVKNQFLQVAKSMRLNPFKKEIYIVKFKEDYSIIVGYETYLRRAERTGLLEYKEITYEGDLKKEQKTVTRYKKNAEPYQKAITVHTGDFRVTVELKRKDRIKPSRYTVWFDEFSVENDNWGTRPRFMLSKVGMALALRWEFPLEFDEMPLIEEEVDIIKRSQETADIQAKMTTEQEAVLNVINENVIEGAVREYYKVQVMATTDEERLKKIAEFVLARAQKAEEEKQDVTSNQVVTPGSRPAADKTNITEAMIIDDQAPPPTPPIEQIELNFGGQENE